MATALAGEQLQVLALGRDIEALASLRAPAIETVAVDIRDEAALRRLLEARQFDVVVHCAGLLSTSGPFQSTDAAQVGEMIGTNLVAPLVLTHMLLPAMIRQKLGHLFFIGSSAGRWPHPNAAVYGASKAGLSLFCDALRCDLLGTGIRVTELAPGRVETRLYRSTLDDAARSALYEGYDPIGPHDIAALVVTALNLPRNVDVSRMEIFPTNQAVGDSRIVKTSD